MQVAPVTGLVGAPQCVVLRTDQLSSDHLLMHAARSTQHTTVDPVPAWVVLTASPGSGWRLLEPIWLTLEIEQRTHEPSVIAYDSLLGVYGVGRNAKEAISEFQSMLLDLYLELEDSQAILSPALRQRWLKVRTILSRT